MTITYENLLAFLYREARLLDDKQWEEWLQLYAPDVEYWMPAWDDDGTLVTGRFSSGRVWQKRS